jgi:hypothetical protein
LTGLFGKYCLARYRLPKNSDMASGALNDNHERRTGTFGQTIPCIENVKKEVRISASLYIETRLECTSGESFVAAEIPAKDVK